MSDPARTATRHSLLLEWIFISTPGHLHSDCIVCHGSHIPLLLEDGGMNKLDIVLSHDFLLQRGPIRK